MLICLRVFFSNFLFFGLLFQFCDGENLASVFFIIGFNIRSIYVYNKIYLSDLYLLLFQIFSTILFLLSFPSNRNTLALWKQFINLLPIQYKFIIMNEQNSILKQSHRKNLSFLQRFSGKKYVVSKKGIIDAFENQHCIQSNRNMITESSFLD